MTPEFWKKKPLEALSDEEWEALCDGCGRCCLVKLEDVDTGDLAHTDVACELFNEKTCRCSDYENRLDRVPDCLQLTPARAADLDWLPPTCAYRLLAHGEDLRWWHPLVSGTFDTVAEAGVSVAGRIVAETDIHEDGLEERCVAWPAEVPPDA